MYWDSLIGIKLAKTFNVVYLKINDTVTFQFFLKKIINDV